MTAALRIRIEELEEEIRQLKAAFAPKVGFPLSWKLEDREGAVLSALFHCKGSYVTPEALLLLLVRYDDDADERTTRTWVGRIRRKVESFGVTIITRPLQGYALDAPGRAVVAEALGVWSPAAEAPPQPKHPKGWTDAEDAIVRAGYERTATLATIRAELAASGFRSRSLGSISQRAQALGHASSRGAVLWSEPEDAILREAYEAGDRITAIRLKLARAGFRRNRGGIQMRAIALGVSGTRVAKWTQPEKAIVRAGIDAGLTYQAIRRELEAKGYDRGLHGIATIAKRMGCGRATAVWTVEETELLRRLYAEKRPVRDIAAQVGRRVPAVASMASKLGLKQRRPWTPDQRAVLLDAFHAGETLDVVCDQIDRPLANVSAEARRMGLQFPPTPRRPQIRRLAA